MRVPKLATLVAVGGLVCMGGCQPQDAQCGGYCGAGTVCEAGRCVVAPPSEPAAEPEPEPSGGKKRRGKKRRRKKGGDTATGLNDRDGHIPRYRANRTEQLGEGSERLSDRKVRQQMSTLEPAFNRCLERASQVTDVALTGTVSFTVGIEPSGKVWGVNARLPSSWGVSGLRACFRKVVFGHRFPSWDGPSMGVDYHFEVD